ncbi:hemoglobin subunit beta-2-like isoform X2 [Hyla sarda]|uniref:hemoglobin subunit beta-2-like isoform X2 n=1 Tax=Hyla sarda TaxID=327740 RepID=UPI0024C296A7|nr:hemoglobin subunit beta-2-like isoform X2 [Hyla sarda]
MEDDAAEIYMGGLQEGHYIKDILCPRSTTNCKRFISTSSNPTATMVQWTAEEKAAITSTWAQVNVEQDGHDTLTRLLVVYPWTQRYFSSFGNLSNVTAISGNAKVHAHGKKVLTAIGGAVQHMDHVKHHLAALSKVHAQELHVDPENFKRLGEVLVIVLASKLGSAFTPQVEAAWEKFINVLVAALSQGYF